MPLSKPVIFLDKTYKSQKDFEKYVKQLIYEEIGICNDIKTLHPDKYQILIKILERHPEFTLKTELRLTSMTFCQFS